ncbi:MAG: phage Gp37/Gp68 family protein [Cyanobacteria bacterium K_Offshore_surface_m2_011]|nr:phage Gp37/Gp68 family protein [Cyanobacteria bacterium K_Offshore_surface_m2_011]
MTTSSIEWTELTWNPTTGCTKYSTGCKYCYAEVMSKRLQAMGVQKYRDAFQVRIHPDQLSLPYTWKTPKIVFVNSMSDLFHKEVPDDFIKKFFSAMNSNPQHVFQVLTKRTERLLKVSSELEWSDNIWMGVSVEDTSVVHRVDQLRETRAHVRFLSCEPLLGPLPSLNLEGIHWLIVGGESGTRPRPMKEDWVLDIQRQCVEQGVKFFFKQWGGRNKKAAGRLLNGRIYDDMPVILGRRRGAA